MEELLTVREVSHYLKLSRTTVWRWCQSGRLRAVKVGRSWRIPRAEVERLVGTKKRQTPAEEAER